MTLKKLLCMVLSFAMILGTMGTVVFAEEADLTISTAEELQAFAASVNAGNDSYEGKTVVLANDIDMEYKAVVIGTKTNPFKGIFDGQEYIVSNITIYEDGSDSDYFADSDDCLGLFGVINSPAVIKNVTVHNPYIVGSSYVGGIVGMGYTGAIENCRVTGEIDIEGFYMVGGINGHGYAKISNCSVVGDEGWDYSYVGAKYKGADLEGDNVGGIVGHNGENNDIIGCEVKNVIVSGTRKVGGIVGIAAQNSDIKDCVVSNVTVETTATEEYATDNAKTMSIGGLVGQYQASGANDGTISGCEVSGLIFANENNVTVSAGAISGGLRGTADSTVAPAETVTASNNTVANVSGANTSYLIPAPVEVSTYEELIAALEKDNANIIMIADITAAATQNSGYGKAGIVLNTGDILDGNGHKLTINDANSTWDCAIAMKGGTVKNLTVRGAMRGIFMPGANGDVIIDNCVLEDVIYTFNSDAGSTEYNVTIKNTTLNGWTSYSAVHKSVMFESCMFGEGNGYAFCRPYQETTFTGCEFNEGFEFDATKVASDDILAFNDCTYAGEELSAETAASMFYNGGTVVIDNETVVFDEYVPVAQIGDFKYTSFQEAIDDAKDGDAIVLLQDIALSDTLTVSADKVINLDLAGHTISQTKEQTAGYQMILNDGNLTIDDSVGNGKISYTDSGNGGEYISDTIYNRGTLTINGGTIENLSSVTVAKNGYPHAVDTYSGIRDTSVTINGGTIYCVNYSAIRMFCVSATYKADLAINGGTIKGAVDMQNGTSKAALGTLNITDGIFETTANVNNIRFANWNGGATEYGIAASISGGTFNGGITTAYVPAEANWNSAIIKGGTYATDVSAYIADDCSAIKDMNGAYIAGVKPTATVNNLGAMTIAEADYNVYGGSKSGDMPLNFVMQFLADQTAEDMETSPYADWYGDFVLTFTGLENGSFIADGCYLAGYYGTFGWVKVPVDGMTIENGVRYPVMLGVGMGQKYEYICSDVKDFRCAMFIPDEILEANPNLKVNLELSVVDNSNGEDAAAEALMDVNSPYTYVVGDTEYTAEDFKSEETLDTKTSFVRNIKTKNAAGEERCQIILFAGIDSLNYEKVGFEVTVDGETRRSETKTVYTSYTAAGKEYTPDDWGENCKYIFALPINFMTDFADKSVIFRPFAVALGEENYIWGDSKTIDKIYNKTVEGE